MLRDDEDDDEEERNLSSHAIAETGSGLNRQPPLTLVNNAPPLAATVHAFGRCHMPGRKRNRLLPWFIGLAIVLVVIGYAGYQMVATSCPVTPPIVLMVLGVVPFVYLALMYLAFTSQE